MPKIKYPTVIWKVSFMRAFGNLLYGVLPYNTVGYFSNGDICSSVFDRQYVRKSGHFKYLSHHFRGLAYHELTVFRYHGFMQ